MVHWDDPEGWNGEEGGMRGSRWGMHVHPWLIHVNVWQKPPRYCKVISPQLEFLKIKKKWKITKKYLYLFCTYNGIFSISSIICNFQTKSEFF